LVHVVGPVSGVKVLQQWVLEQQCLQPWQAAWLHLMSSNSFSPHSGYVTGAFLGMLTNDQHYFLSLDAHL
jgi:hypothetical protein